MWIKQLKTGQVVVNGILFDTWALANDYIKTKQK